MNISETRKGELYILGQSIIWAFFPIVTIISFREVPPLFSLAISSVFLVLMFGIILGLRGKFKELSTPGVWKYLPLITIFITFLYYGLYFTGLKFTTPGNAGIIALMEIFFSYLYFNVWRKEFFSASHTIGAVLMLVGALIILYPKHSLGLMKGDYIIFLATIFPPIGNYYQQKLRKIVSGETIVFLRSLAAVPIFFAMAYLLKATAPLASVQKTLWILAINGILILGVSKFMWMEGIHRISVTKANALSSIAPLFTLLFAALLLHQSPTIWQLGSFVPIAAGLYLLTS